MINKFFQFLKSKEIHPISLAFKSKEISHQYEITFY